jgi:putative tricarboxylic transport membrane protein
MIPNSTRVEILLGLGLVALGVFFAVETTEIKVAPIYAKVGPTVFPWIVAGALILLGLIFAAQAWRKGQQASASERDPVPGQANGSSDLHAEASDWRALLLISAALLLQAALFKMLGFVLTAALLFMAVAYGFGSRSYLRDGIVAVILAILVYVGFTRGLHLQLPAGVFAGWL